VRYVILGVNNIVAGVAVFTLLYWIFEDTVNVNGLLMINGIINNLFGFVLHKILTFEVGGSPSKQLPKFLALSLLSLGTPSSFRALSEPSSISIQLSWY